MSEAGGPSKLSVSIPQDELTFTYARSSGAGGQNVNKVNSKAILRWNPGTSRAMSQPVKERFLGRFGSKLTIDGDLVLMSDSFRDQGRNAADCLEKLKAMIVSVLTPPKKRTKTKPTYGSKLRRLKAKSVNSEKKQNRKIRHDD